jgi:cell division protein FtsI/penicillin-binding protein 2
MRRIARQGWRQLVVLLAMLLVFGDLAKSLVTLQVMSADNTKYQHYYAADVAGPQIQKPPRGTIVDAKGAPLVGTLTVYKLAASPQYVTKKETTARLLTDVLFPLRLPGGKHAHDAKRIAKAHADYRSHYQAILDQLNSGYTYVCLAGDDSPTCPAHFDISQTTANTIAGLTIPGTTTPLAGLSLEPRDQSTYPNGQVASQVLGYVTYTYPNGQPVDTGQYGLERYYDNLLRGIPGHISVRHDTHGDPIRVGTGTDASPQPGATITTTIDSYVQLLVEQELAQAVKIYGAASGTIIVEQPKTGAILAMASAPTYDPNHWQQLVNQTNIKGHGTNSTVNLFTNPAISNQYEPGSTFKAFTVAIGLDSHSFSPTTTVLDTGTLKLPADGITIRNWCLDECTFGGYEDVSKMLHYSSNIGAAQFGRMIPVTTWYDYLNRFGFGSLSGVDLAGEIPGDIRKPTGDHSGIVWVPAYKDTQAYGQGLTVTALQLTNAYASLANGGWLMVPQVMQSYTLDGKTTVVQPERVRQAISSDTDAQMNDILVHQAINGEACKALVPGYDVAAKTGTASISVAGGYSPNQTIASTAAYAPAEDPRFVVLVVLNKPSTQWGSLTASPTVHDILQKLFDYYKVPPLSNPIQPLTACPFPDST